MSSSAFPLLVFSWTFSTAGGTFVLMAWAFSRRRLQEVVAYILKKAMALGRRMVCVVHYGKCISIRGHAQKYSNTVRSFFFPTRYFLRHCFMNKSVILNFLNIFLMFVEMYTVSFVRELICSCAKPCICFLIFFTL